MDNFERRKKELLTPLLFEAGAALLDCQSFEYSVCILLFHFSRLGAEGLDPGRMVAIMEDIAKKTAGQLVKLLKQHLALSEGIDVALQEALAARNKLIHRFLIDNIERFPDQAQRETLTKEIRSLRRQVQKAEKMLRPFIEGLTEALDGVDLKQFRADAISKFLEAS